VLLDCVVDSMDDTRALAEIRQARARGSVFSDRSCVLRRRHVFHEKAKHLLKEHGKKSKFIASGDVFMENSGEMLKI